MNGREGRGVTVYCTIPDTVRQVRPSLHDRALLHEFCSCDVIDEGKNVIDEGTLKQSSMKGFVVVFRSNELCSMNVTARRWGFGRRHCQTSAVTALL